MQLLDIAFRPKSRAPMQTKSETMVSKVAGVEHDSRGKPGKRQVTVLSLQQWLLACDEVGTTLPWTVRRANLLSVESIHSGIQRFPSLLTVKNV